MKLLVESNRYFLNQAKELLEQLDNATYARPSPRFYHSTIGGHMRHCLDHYLSFLCSTTNRDRGIDYDQRERKPQIEEDVTVAQGCIQQILTRLSEMEVSDSNEVLVKMDCGSDCCEWVRSTAARELQFLVSHTLHHFAMIGGICHEHGVDCGEGFGVAPSTLRFRKEREKPREAPAG